MVEPTGPVRPSFTTVAEEARPAVPGPRRAADRVERKRPSVTAPAPKKLHIAGGDAGYSKALEAYRAAHAAYVETALAPYWRDVVAKEQGRSGRLIGSFSDADFVSVAPPVYQGPAKPKPKDYGLPTPKEQPSTIPVIADFKAAAAQRGYTFDYATDELGYKTSYAKAALKFGLTAAQILGVYAFETAGTGLSTEQPKSKSGRPISTALGPAQLLAANSVNTLAQHGRRIAEMLDKDGKNAKADLVRRMQAEILAVSNNHQVPDVETEAKELGRTPLGRAVHAANLDADIGPYLQSVKLADIVDHYNAQARANGMPVGTLEPWRLEGMNLAGLEVGFQMIHPDLARRLGLNFFKEDGYEANPVVAKTVTAGALIARMKTDMTSGSFIRAKGYRQLARIFEQLTAKADDSRSPRQRARRP